MMKTVKSYANHLREIIGLTWECYNSTRTLSIPNFLADMLNVESENKKPEEPIVTVSLITIRKHLEKICKNNAIPSVRLHDLMHPYVKPMTKIKTLHLI